MPRCGAKVEGIFSQGASPNIAMAPGFTFLSFAQEASMSFARLFFALMFSVLPAFAQQASNPASATAGVPSLVNFNGVLRDVDGRPLRGVVSVTFSLYQEQEGGSPLWLETQNVSPDIRGRFSVELGSSSRNGLPTELFSTAEARWLGIQAAGQPEQNRVLLVSVPYALKAKDAETIGGLPPSAFILAPTSGGNLAASQGGSSSSTEIPSKPEISPAVGGAGTQDFIPLWTDANGNLGNSVLYQSGTGSSARIGVNITQPLTTLDVNGMTLIRGKLEPITQGVATASKSFNSNPLDLEASSFSSTTQKAVMQHFEWQAEPTGNNTGNPGATLHLLFGQDNKTPAETGLSLSKTGVFTFAAGQGFPGAGTVSSVGLSAPSSDFAVSGSPITKNGTLALTWSVAPTSSDVANAMVKRDANGSFSAGPISTSTATSAPAISALDNGSNVAVSGSSIGGVGVIGESQNSIGVYGSGNGGGVEGSGYGGSNGVTGVSDGAYGVYGVGGTGVEANGFTYGVSAYGSTVGAYGNGPIGVYGDSDGSYGNGVYAVNRGTGGTALYSYSFTGYSATFDGPTGHCDIDGDGNLYCTGQQSTVVPLEDVSRHVALYAMESPENWFEDFGSGRLTSGEATIPLEHTFAQTVNAGRDYYVFPVPNGDCKGLYVTEKTGGSFVVRELGGGKSNVAFDYRIIARRKGFENVRLADKTSAFKNKPKPLSPPGRPPIPSNTPRLRSAQHFLYGLQSATPSTK
jgi:hypothetical protein